MDYLVKVIATVRAVELFPDVPTHPMPGSTKLVSDIDPSIVYQTYWHECL